MASKIYTRKGDKGFTSLMGTSKRYSKTDSRICAIGSIDELNAHVGMIRSHLKEDDISQQELKDIQNELFNIGAYLANVGKGNSVDFNVEWLENIMDFKSKRLPPLKNFILPMGNTAMCCCHVARTVCRRAERDLVALSFIEPTVLKYINRLSDYFFVLSREIALDYQIPETIWTLKND